MIDKNFFHVGLVVAHVETAMGELGALLGLEWHGISEQVMPTYQPGIGHRDVPVRVGYSHDRPFLELIEAVPGTPWELARDGGSNLHHIGFYTDQLDEDSKAVGSSFCPIEICATSAEQAWPLIFTYHNQSKSGLRIELVQNPR
jgi:hypothetical protein